MTVKAPFRFAPIPRFVYFPEWADCVSHDVPFEDSLCGEIALEIRAETPLLVGGPRRKATDKAPGEVWPIPLPDGRYMIPSSTLQGLVRSILEVAAFGKLGLWIDDKRYGIRDLTDAAKPYYRDRLVNNVRAGFLRLEPDGSGRLQRCELKRIAFADIGAKGNWTGKSSAPERYGWISDIGPFAVTARGNSVRLNADRNGRGWLVVTGHTGVKDAEKAKSREFVFIEQDHIIPVTPKVISDFRFIHEDYSGTDRTRWNPTWKYFLEKGYPASNKTAAAGGRFPVFFVEKGGDVEAIGLAYMFKLAHEKSTHELLANSSPDHLDAGRVDLASLIFGLVAGNAGVDGLKRRAAFDAAIAPKGAKQIAAPGATVLSAPKPSYFPIYLRQPQGAEPGKLPLDGNRYLPYATYTPLTDSPRLKSEHRTPELSGVKIWPVSAERPFSGGFKLPPPPFAAEKNLRVQTRLHAVEAETVFTTVLRFHNLRPVELGAVLWTLTFGDREALNGRWGIHRHRLGMGKPFGMGAVSIRLTETLPPIRAADEKSWSPVDLMEAFEAKMEAVCQGGHPNGSWTATPQYRALTRSSERAANAGELLDYMQLQPQHGASEESTYVGEKKRAGIMVPYVDGGGTPDRHAGRQVTPPPCSPSGSPPPTLDARVRANRGERQGTIIGEPKPGNRQWQVQWDGETKPQWLNASAFTVIA